MLLGSPSTLVILCLWPFVIIEVIDPIVGNHAELGKLSHVIVVVLSLVLGRALMRGARLALADGSAGVAEPVEPC